MITPKQIESSHGGRGTRQRHTHKTQRDKTPGRKQKPPRDPRNASKTDPLFNALRDELGL